MPSSGTVPNQRASFEVDGADRDAVPAARQGAPARPGSIEALTSPAPVGSSPHAARPNTPATADSRAVYRSPSAAMSRSVDLSSSVPGTGPALLPPRPERTATAPNLAMADLDSMDPRVGGPSWVPQPPPSGSPGISGSSPRLRTVSSRTLTIKGSLTPTLSLRLVAGEEDGDDAADAPELCLSQSPKLGSAACPLTPDTAQSPRAETAVARSSGRPPALPVPQPSYNTALSGGVSPAGSAAGALRLSRTPPGSVAAAAAAVSPVSTSDAESKGDPWVALRAHCMAAYGGDAGSDEDDHGGGPGGDASRLMLMRHPSLLTRSLSRSLREAAAAAAPTTTSNASSASGPASAASATRRRPGPADKHPTIAPSTASTAVAAAAATELTAGGGGGGDGHPSISAVAVMTAVPAGREKVSAAVSSAATGAGGGDAAAGSGVPTRRTTSGAAPVSPIPGAAAATAAAPATVSLRPIAATASGAPPDLSGATLARARMAAAATLQLQPPPPQHQHQHKPPQTQHQSPQTQPQRGAAGQRAGAAAGRAPLPPLPPPSPSGSLSPRASTEVSPLTRGSDSGAAATASMVAGTPPRSRRNSASGAAAVAGGSLRASVEASPFVTAAATMLDGVSSYPAAPSPSRSPLHIHKPPPPPPHPAGAVGRGAGDRGGAHPADVGGMSSLGSAAAMAMAALEEQLQEQLLLEITSGAAGGGGGTGDRRVSESGGVAAVFGSILDAPPLNADPVRKRRLSADGLNRHASKYMGGGGGHGSGDGAAPAAAVATPAESGSGPGKSVTVDGGGLGGGGVAAVSVSVSGGNGGGGGGSPSVTVTSPGAPLSTGSSPSSGRAPLITALAFERAPWSAAPAGGGGGAAAASSPAAGSPADGAAVLKGLPRPHHPPLPRVPGLSPPQRPHPVALPFDRAVMSPPGAGATAAAAAVTAVDQLRGYKSSKILLSSLMSTTSGNIPAMVGGAASTADATAAAAVPTAVTGLSPPAVKPKLGPFASMRTLRTHGTTAASFLERLSGSSNLTAPAGHGRVSSRRTIGGGIGGGGGGEWAPEGQRQQHSFRRREGSCSLDGSGCDVHVGASLGPPQLQIDSAAGGSSGSGSGGGGGGSNGWTGQAAMGLTARRSYKQLLPRGPNGLPLAWSAIEEDGREGNDGGEGGEEGGGKRRQHHHAATDDEGDGRSEPGAVGGGGAADEGRDEGDSERDDDDDDEDDGGFNRLARGGGWVDLHQTC